LKERSHDTIAGSKPRDAFAYLSDLPGAVREWNKIAGRGLSEVRASDDCLIPSVQRCGAESNEYLAGPWSRIRTLHLTQLGDRLAPTWGNVSSHGLTEALRHTL
jgi:hypothetical protein